MSAPQSALLLERSVVLVLANAMPAVEPAKRASLVHITW